MLKLSLGFSKGTTSLEGTMRITRYLVSIAGLGLAVLTLGCGQNSPTAPLAPGAAIQPEGKPTSGGTSGTYEKSYMQTTINHEEFIRQLSVLAMGKQGLHAETTTFAQNAAAYAGQNVGLLQSYLSQWFGIQFSPSLSGSSQKTLNNFAAREGADFEKAFLNQMISDDQVRVRDGQRCYARATHTMLILFGYNVQLDATHEIAQLKSWLCQWYSAC